MSSKINELVDSYVAMIGVTKNNDVNNDAEEDAGFVTFLDDQLGPQAVGDACLEILPPISRVENVSSNASVEMNPIYPIYNFLLSSNYKS